MRQFIVAIAALGLILPGSTIHAVTIVQCEDADGHRTYQANCPPGTQVVETRRIYTGPEATGPDLEALKTDKPVTLYSVKTCEACDLVRDYLQNRGIPFSEKGVANDAELQEELRSKTGELSVPAVTIGAETVMGYNKTALKNALDEAGYPDNTAGATVKPGDNDS